MKLIFATGNNRKISEARDVLSAYGIDFDNLKLEMDEIQHQDPAEITKAKVLAAYELVHQPVVVSDTSWGIPALGGFPGGYMKDIEDWLTSEDWLAVMNRHEDKTIHCYEHVAYFDGENLKHFDTKYTGTFIDEIRGSVSADESFENVVVMFGDKTMAEYADEGLLASAGSELTHWQQFAEWYNSQNA